MLWPIRISLVALLLTLMATAKAAAPSDVFAYAAASKGRIYGYRVAANGALLPLNKGAITNVMERPMMAAHPSGRYLYVAQTFDNDKEGYTLEDTYDQRGVPRRLVTELRVLRVWEDGSLRPIQTVTVKGLVGGVRPHPKGTLLYCVCTEGQVLIYRVGLDGQLKEQGRTEVIDTFAGSNIPSGYGGWNVAFTPDGRYAFWHAYQSGSDWVFNYLQCYRVLANGRLKAVGPKRMSNGEGYSDTTVQAGPVAFHHTSKLAFISTGYDGIHLYRWGANGQMTRHPQRQLPFPSEQKIRKIWWPDIKAVDPLGRYVVIGGSSSGSFNALYRIRSDGHLARTDTFGGPGQLIVEPTGRFVYELSHPTMSVYQIDDGGKVTKSTASMSMLVADETIKEILFVAPKAPSGVAERKK